MRQYLYLKCDRNEKRIAFRFPNSDAKVCITQAYIRNPAIAEGPRDAGVPVEIW